MKRSASAVLLALAAFLVARADDAKAPLDDAKQQLRQLQKDQDASKSGAGDASLKGALPDLKTTLQGREVLPSTALDPNQNNRDQQGRKKAEKKNWLVDGYDRLDPKSGNTKTGDRIVAGDTQTDEKEKEPEPGDQDYLIKLYEKQAKASDVTSIHDKQAGAKVAHTPPPDPLAPFLQVWLANSPVRDAAMSAVPRNDGGTGANTGSAGGPLVPDGAPLPPGGGVGGSQVTVSGPPPAAENPYLLTLTMPALPGNSPAAAPAPSLSSADSPAGRPLVRPTVNGPPDSLAPPARSDVRKPPPTPADDDKKYFPQLKRF